MGMLRKFKAYAKHANAMIRVMLDALLHDLSLIIMGDL